VGASQQASWPPSADAWRRSPTTSWSRCTDQRARGACYLRGLLLDGRRKSVEPMAARLGEVHHQALHHFVAVSPWDWRPVRRRLAERLSRRPGANGVGGG
jgi:DDE superfamily endonuclease